MTKLHFTPPTEFPAEYVTDEGVKITLLARGIGKYPYIGQDGLGHVCSFTEKGEGRYSDRLNLYDIKKLPKRLVTWVQWDEEDAVCCENHKEANWCLNNYGGYIYKIERDDDGSNPTIELVETGSVAADNEVKGGKDE